MNKYLKAFLESLLQFLTASGGVAAGVYGMKLVPVFNSPKGADGKPILSTIDKAAPGVIAGIGAFALSTFVDNKYARLAAIGVGIAAVIDLLNKFTADSTNTTVIAARAYIPKLGSSTGANPGTIPAEYWLNLPAAGRPLGALPARSLGALPSRGLGSSGNKAYGLMGSGNKAYGLMGTDNKAYGLMGN